MYVRSRLSVLALTLVVAASCEPREQDTSPLDTGDFFEDSEESGLDCNPDDVELDGMGPEHPVVGDLWTFYLRCDGITLLGTFIMQVDPPEFAYIKQNTATFQEAGTGTFSMQVGAYAGSLDVTVGKAR
jgi:hypothetical protein